MNNTIPTMTDSLGAHWKQPGRARILIDDTHAVMDATTFQQLAEYSGSFPGGVYPGKMWRRHDGLFDRSCAPENRQWLLVWFGEGADKTKCTVNFRIILVCE